MYYIKVNHLRALGGMCGRSLIYKSGMGYRAGSIRSKIKPFRAPPRENIFLFKKFRLKTSTLYFPNVICPWKADKVVVRPKGIAIECVWPG